MQSPDWSHVANPSRCQFCRSEYHLSADEFYPEPASIQLALTHLLRNDRPRCRGREDATVDSCSVIRGNLDSVRWRVDGKEDWSTNSSAERISDSDESESGTCAGTAVEKSLELSDLYQTNSDIMDSRSEEWYGNSVEDLHIHDMESWNQRQNDIGQRHRLSSASREWVVRRRSDGSRYIRRRGDSVERRRSAQKAYSQRHSDPARQSQPPPSTHLSHQHGSIRDDSNFDVEPPTENVIHTTMLDQRIAVDRDDYSSKEWIYSPNLTDSSCRIVAVI